jgi:hypothetical protein
MTRTIRSLLACEAAAFAMAALIHAGRFVSGYEHAKAKVAETVIAMVLLAGLGFCLVRPGATRSAALAVQGFALLGTLVGIFTIAIGVGPKTSADIVYHVFIVAVLLFGLNIAFKQPNNNTERTIGKGARSNE